MNPSLTTLRTRTNAVPTVRKLLLRIALISTLLGVVCAVVLGVLIGFPSAFSSLVGTLLGVVNLYVLAWLVVGMMNDQKSNASRGRAAVLLGAKALALVTVVGILVVNRWVRGGALMAGLSVVALSIVLGAMLGSKDETPLDPPSTRND